MFRQQKSHIKSFIHLKDLPNGAEALRILRLVSRMVKPIMRRRGWKIRTLAELRPRIAQLYGSRKAHSTTVMNQIFPGIKWNSKRWIYLRLRSRRRRGEFLSFGKIMNSMLRELAQIDYERGSSGYNRLLQELRDEYEGMVRRQNDTIEGQSDQPEATAQNPGNEGAVGGPGQNALGQNAPMTYEDANERMELLEQCAQHIFNDAEINLIVQATVQGGIETRAEEDDMDEEQATREHWEEYRTERARYEDPPMTENPARPRVVEFSSWIIPSHQQ